MIGSTIDGKYLVKNEIGKGGMGSVYEAEHAATGRRVAVKVINSGDLTKDQQVLSRFEREARAAGAIDTQYITQVLDAGLDRDSNLPFMAMEYLEGEDLQRMLKRVGPISPELALRVTAQACLGLRKAHDAKVVHRDIKPHNLFLARRDAGEVIVKLLDFGIAKVKMDQAQSRDGADLTKTGNLLGSPLYV
ncbi:MAG: serine/threonine-protein kinase, partial [Myxococcota bacterium]